MRIELIIGTETIAVQQPIDKPASFAAEMTFTEDDLIVRAGFAAVPAKDGGIGFLHSASYSGLQKTFMTGIRLKTDFPQLPG